MKNRLQPHPDYPIIIGLDPGSVYNSFTFMQWLPVEDKLKWVVFDELAIFKKRVAYPQMIPAVMRRIVFWRKEVGKDIPQIWISDSSAFNVYRQAHGSFDVLDIEKIYDAHRGALSLEPLKIKEAPKFNDSVKIRVRLLQTILSQDEIVISTGCPLTKKMLLLLDSEQQKPGTSFDPDLSMKPKRSDWIHIFDSLTYPMITASIHPNRLTVARDSGQTLITAR